MLQAIEVHRSGELSDVPIDEHLDALAALADRKKLTGPQRGPPPALSGEGVMTKDDRLLRIGVLGCGPIAQFAHFDACRKARNAELYAICDVADDLRERMAAVHRPRVAYARLRRDARRPAGRGGDRRDRRPVPRRRLR